MGGRLHAGFVGDVTRFVAVVGLLAGCGSRTGLALPDGPLGSGTNEGSPAQDAAIQPPDASVPADDASIAPDGPELPPCGASLVRCGDECVDVANEPAHCGGCGVACAPGGTCRAGICFCARPVLSSVSPPNAKNDVAASQPLLATFSCAPDPSISKSDGMRVSGRFASRLRGIFPQPMDPRVVELDPLAPDPVRKQAYFAGEPLTAWLGPTLGGPFLWQFNATVRAHSSGTFQDTGRTLGASASAMVDLGDFDHDGDLDAITWMTDTASLWANDGTGHFTLRATLNTTSSPLLGDFDGDGNLDVAGSRLFLNAGDFTFVGGDSLGAPFAEVDVDGDGDLDVVAVLPDRYGTREVIQVNDGTGHFTASDLGTGPLWDVKAGDLDNDGDLDLVALVLGAGTGTSERGAVFLNDGKGHFVETPAGLSVDATRTIALGDLDGDGDLDVFLASWGAAGARNPPDQVWLNDGKAHFTAGSSPLSGSPEIVLGDLDGDGDLDVIAGQHDPYSTTKGQPSVILLNDGQARFAIGGPLGGAFFQQVRLGDLDGDGDLDAVIAEWDWQGYLSAAIWMQD